MKNFNSMLSRSACEKKQLYCYGRSKKIECLLASYIDQMPLYNTIVDMLHNK